MCYARHIEAARAAAEVAEARGRGLQPLTAAEARAAAAAEGLKLVASSSNATGFKGVTSKIGASTMQMSRRMASGATSGHSIRPRRRPYATLGTVTSKRPKLVNVAKSASASSSGGATAWDLSMIGRRQATSPRSFTVHVACTQLLLQRRCMHLESRSTSDCT